MLEHFLFFRADRLVGCRGPKESNFGSCQKIAMEFKKKYGWLGLIVRSVLYSSVSIPVFIFILLYGNLTSVSPSSYRHL